MEIPQFHLHVRQSSACSPRSNHETHLWQAGDTGDSPVAVNARVRVYPGTDAEVCGTVVEDFGDLAGHAVDIGENHIVGPAPRWAVALDAGELVSSTATSWPPSSFSCRSLQTLRLHDLPKLSIEVR